MNLPKLVLNTCRVFPLLVAIAFMRYWNMKYGPWIGVPIAMITCAAAIWLQEILMPLWDRDPKE